MRELQKTPACVHLMPRGVAGSTLGFCFWTASSSLLVLFHPNHPLTGGEQTQIRRRTQEKTNRNKKRCVKQCYIKS